MRSPVLQQRPRRLAAIHLDGPNRLQHIAFRIARQAGVQAGHIGDQRNIHVSIVDRLPERHPRPQTHQITTNAIDPQQKSRRQTVAGQRLAVGRGGRTGQGDRHRLDGFPGSRSCLAGLGVLRGDGQHLLAQLDDLAPPACDRRPHAVEPADRERLSDDGRDRRRTDRAPLGDRASDAERAPPHRGLRRTRRDRPTRALAANRASPPPAPAIPPNVLDVPANERWPHRLA